MLYRTGPENEYQTNGHVPRQRPDRRTSVPAGRPSELQQHEEESGAQSGTDPGHDGQTGCGPERSGRDVHPEGQGGRLEELHVARAVGQVRPVHRRQLERDQSHL